MDSIIIWLYALSTFLVLMAALARKYSGVGAFGFAVLAVVGTPIIAYAYLMALPMEPTPSRAPERSES